ncbi:hypothetical protein [Flammeovirga kamogawensis]|uniref:Uncharacterized protein n=1 Tax=Flammeovirga kamogawensis TaxID=373891 RepID=A0ABX8GXX6_9BACT|nr:hypothetical protein [Flammeovirga kamogawensis]MBB6462820.1 hypothetical protein [Flammeovirga kamogawensis]QWG08396.1 hypothetical protein KM029_05525 [Flammeovirga kamogawensis]TRX66691.1 hypothetical protein EO216_00580 [Flammeovirga kamogawensis]
MIIFKNTTATVEWDVLAKSIECTWKHYSNVDEMEEVILAIIDLSEANDIDFYVSNRTDLTFIWSGHKEWSMFKKFNFNLRHQFSDIFILDHQKEKNLPFFLALSKTLDVNFNYKKSNYFRHRRVLDAHIKEISLKN